MTRRRGHTAAPARPATVPVTHCETIVWLTSTLDSRRADKQTCHVRNEVRALREHLDLSQGALGEALGVSRQTINSIEVGRYIPSLPLALKLARFFGQKVEEIFDDGE